MGFTSVICHHLPSNEWSFALSTINNTALVSSIIHVFMAALCLCLLIDPAQEADACYAVQSSRPIVSRGWSVHSSGKGEVKTLFDSKCLICPLFHSNNTSHRSHPFRHHNTVFLYICCVPCKYHLSADIYRLNQAPLTPHLHLLLFLYINTVNHAQFYNKKALNR